MTAARSLEQIYAAIEADNQIIRQRFIDDVPCYPEPPASAKGTAVLGVPWAGKVVYPAFQFDPRGINRTVIAALMRLPESMSSWEKAIWFVSSNGWLDGAAPVNRLDAEEAILYAARMENALIG